MTWEHLVFKSNQTWDSSSETHASGPRSDSLFRDLLSQVFTIRSLTMICFAIATFLTNAFQAGWNNLEKSLDLTHLLTLDKAALFSCLVFGGFLISWFNLQGFESKQLMENELVTRETSFVPGNFCAESQEESEGQSSHFLLSHFLDQSMLVTVASSLLFFFLLNFLWKIVLNFGAFYKMWKYFSQFDGPPRHWLYGSLNLIPPGRHVQQFAKWSQQYGGKFVMWQGPFNPQLIVSDLDSVKTILATSDPKAWAYNALRPWLGDGLLLTSGKKWFRNRRLFTPAFHYNILRPYQLVFSHCANTLVEKWTKLCQEQESGIASVEMFSNVSMMTLDSLMRCIFGVESHFQLENKPNPYVVAVNELSDLSLYRNRNPLYQSDLIYKLSPMGRQCQKALDLVHSFSTNVIQERRKVMESGAVPSNNQRKYRDFLDILLECRDSEGSGFPDSEIRDEVDTFMFEGHDTTASGLSWCLYYLACYPEFQEKCREEVKEVLGDRKEVQWDDLRDLPFLTMFIKESLRLSPPVGNIGRLTSKQITLHDGKVIPQGTSVTIAIYACHHNPNTWEDPEVFDPYRFNYENSKDRHPYAFIPFSAGSRNCIGQHFAMNELKTATATLLRHFQFFKDENYEVYQLNKVVLRAAQPGLFIKMKPVYSLK